MTDPNVARSQSHLRTMESCVMTRAVLGKLVHNDDDVDQIAKKLSKTPEAVLKYIADQHISAPCRSLPGEFFISDVKVGTSLVNISISLIRNHQCAAYWESYSEPDMVSHLSRQPNDLKIMQGIPKFEKKLLTKVLSSDSRTMIGLAIASHWVNTCMKNTIQDSVPCVSAGENRNRNFDCLPTTHFV